MLNVYSFQSYYICGLEVSSLENLSILNRSTNKVKHFQSYFTAKFLNKFPRGSTCERGVFLMLHDQRTSQKRLGAYTILCSVYNNCL